MSCFGGRDEQIYMIEMLIDRLTLTPGKIKDIGDHPVAIKIKFLDFPVFQITRLDFYSLRPEPPGDDGSMEFMIGRSCLFIKQPKDLVRELQSNTVKVGVFRLGDTYPTAETEVTLPGCLCDQVAMVQNEPESLPKPFVLKGTFRLVDPGENPSGTLELELRLTCFGRSIVTQYELHPKFFVFKNDGKEREFCVRRLLPPENYPEGGYKNVKDYPDRTTFDELTDKKPEAAEVRKKSNKKKRGKKGKGGRKKRGKK